jgi:hypothetical protein
MDLVCRCEEAQKGRAAVSGFCRKKSSLKRLDMQGDGEM